MNTYHAPGGLGVRVDSALYSGYTVPPHYDSLVAKLVVHAPTRVAATPGSSNSPGSRAAGVPRAAIPVQWSTGCRSRAAP